MFRQLSVAGLQLSVAGLLSCAALSGLLSLAQPAQAQQQPSFGAPSASSGGGKAVAPSPRSGPPAIAGRSVDRPAARTPGLSRSPSLGRHPTVRVAPSPRVAPVIRVRPTAKPPRVQPPIARRVAPHTTRSRHRAWRQGLQWRWLAVPTILLAQELDWCHYHRYAAAGMRFHSHVECHRHADWRHPSIRYVEAE